MKIWPVKPMRLKQKSSFLISPHNVGYCYMWPGFLKTNAGLEKSLNGLARYTGLRDLEILSSTTSASDFTINNHRLFVLPLTFTLLHTILWFCALVCRNIPIRNVLKICRLPKGLSLLHAILFYSPSWKALSWPLTSKSLGLWCFLVLPLSLPSCFLLHTQLQVLGLT
jgi:hypothetical protein